MNLSEKPLSVPVLHTFFCSLLITQKKVLECISLDSGAMCHVTFYYSWELSSEAGPESESTPARYGKNVRYTITILNIISPAIFQCYILCAESQTHHLKLMKEYMWELDNNKHSCRKDGMGAFSCHFSRLSISVTFWACAVIYPLFPQACWSELRFADDTPCKHLQLHRRKQCVFVRYILRLSLLLQGVPLLHHCSTCYSFY